MAFSIYIMLSSGYAKEPLTYRNLDDFSVFGCSKAVRPSSIIFFEPSE